MTLQGREVYTIFADHLTDFKLVRAFFNTSGELVKTLPAPPILSGKQSQIKANLK